MTRLHTAMTTTISEAKTTQGEFARSLGVSRAQLLGVASGKLLPSLTFALRLSARLGRPVNDFWEVSEVGIRARYAHDRRR